MKPSLIPFLFLEFIKELNFCYLAELAYRKLHAAVPFLHKTVPYLQVVAHVNFVCLRSPQNKYNIARFIFNYCLTHGVLAEFCVDFAHWLLFNNLCFNVYLA